MSDNKREVILKLMRAPGDIVVFTNLIRDLHQLNDKLVYDVLTPFPEITYNNPYITRLPKDIGIEVVDLTNISLFQYRKSCFHYSTAYINWMNENWLNEYNQIRQTSIFPNIYLTEKEKDTESIKKKYGISGDFWLINCGIKGDIPLKAFPLYYWEYIINELKIRGIQLIQVGSHNDIHPEFSCIKSLVGKTENLRDFLSLCYSSSGMISGVTMISHVAAAFKKPCVVLAGGRETPNWEMYPNQQFLSTVGFFDCCREGGCWFSQRQMCINMVGSPPYPLCQISINPVTVIDSVIQYDKFKER